MTVTVPASRFTVTRRASSGVRAMAEPRVGPGCVATHPGPPPVPPLPPAPPAPPVPVAVVVVVDVVPPPVPPLPPLPGPVVDADVVVPDPLDVSVSSPPHPAAVAAPATATAASTPSTLGPGRRPVVDQPRSFIILCLLR